MDRKTKGKIGEAIVEKHYKSNGYLIVETNYRFGRFEIDLMVKRKDLLVFIEVKMRSSTDYGEPETFVSTQQQDRIREAAEYFIHEEDWKGEIRFDIATVDSKGHVEVFYDAF